jgi:hypothetical protein
MRNTLINPNQARAAAVVAGLLTLLAGPAVASVQADATTDRVTTAPPRLSARLLRQGDLRGFSPLVPTFTSDPAKWAHSCAGGATSVAHAGFLTAAAEHLKSPLPGRDAVSLVARFRTAAGATNDVRTFVVRHSNCSRDPLSRFTVSEIPGAYGLDVRQKDGEGYDVVFADGQYSYDVGAFTAHGAPPTRNDVAAAAIRLYHRVHALQAAARHGQTLAFEAVYTKAGTAGPPASKVGHLQTGSGNLRDIDGTNVGSFSFSCRWIAVFGNGDANERCSGTATTIDGRLDFAGPSRESAPVHTWQLINGGGAYKGAQATIRVRDVTPMLSIAALTVTSAQGMSIRAGLVTQPAADATFRQHANSLCSTAAAHLAALPRFPFNNFDPLHPDKTALPKVGRFFAGLGDARPILHHLTDQLIALGPPPANTGSWQRVITTEQAALAARDQQIRAALAADPRAFAASVSHVGTTAGDLALAATAFGVEKCIF